ncbi:MAG: DNA polymerase III subunit gamma/tau [Candidatus Saccharibacteria bacterium]|nr:DNA polymerase III subunit gamma/tau [Candidatus Saccharibacteria bacterium]
MILEGQHLQNLIVCDKIVLMQALYRKYRPKSFEEVVGQEQVTDILKLAVQNKRTSHGYLLVGPRGVGKTTIARILAYSINDIKYDLDSNHIDIIEIDAASNTSVDNIRDIIDKAYIAPVDAKYKVYIIDEVHMLSKSAFNAFLKLLEEPPKHVVFILATTDEHKIPATIISRTQRFVFKKIDNQSIIKRLREIADAEQIRINDIGLASIAEYSAGGLRDAINLLDQLSSLAGDGQVIEQKLIDGLTGSINQTILAELLQSYHQRDLATMVKIIDRLLEDNFTSTEIAKQLARIAKQELLANSANLRLISELLKVEGSSMPDLELIVALGSTLQLSDKKQLTEAVVAKAPLQKQNATASKQGNHEIEPKIAAITNSKPTQLESVINIMGGGEEIAINE